MKENNVHPTEEDMRMSYFSEVLALIFVTLVILGSTIIILFF